MAGELQDVRFVLDHLGNPPLGAPELVLWERSFRALAAHPNTSAKLSGVAAAFGRPDWTLDMCRGAIEIALDAFGPERLMYGSDWPVVELVGGSARWQQAVAAVADDLSPDEQRGDLWRDRCQRVRRGDPMNVAVPTVHKLPPVMPSGLGFGGASLGNLRRSIEDEQAYAAIQRAWSRGVRYFDTAPHYGLGLSERRLGRVLSELPRGEFVLSTKVGRLLVPRSPPAPVDDDGFAVPGDLERRWDFSVYGVERSLRESRERLGVDHVDIAFVHDPDQAWDGASREGLRSLATLRAAGEVAAIGIGTNSTAGLVKLIDDRELDVLMLAGRYTLLDHFAGLPVLEAAARQGVAVVIAGVFNSGLLATPRPVEGARFDYRVASPDMIVKVHRIADVCEAHGVDVPAVAIAFARRHRSVASVVVGMRSAREVDDNADRFDTAIPNAVWGDLVSRGLIDERCAA